MFSHIAFLYISRRRFIIYAIFFAAVVWEEAKT